jgi:hypothetical protein
LIRHPFSLAGYDVSLISASAEDHEHWVHINVVALIADDARAVNEHFK